MWFGYTLFSDDRPICVTKHFLVKAGDIMSLAHSGRSRVAAAEML